eukprot:CAMPEP_0182864026 /NCGR_PEP_ID=MMETSP0034_2-20130328/6957_1 /TAXON_ID=156128 /ORGANISM="Nephroselmis pyriformis, Strain CCMP717" /LENGTH=401 /DNA_ID=CAMNT_0024996273 /DNA_START=150 /DNA_END=1352 /DNA_ORIENTATION=+
MLRLFALIIWAWEGAFSIWTRAWDHVFANWEESVKALARELFRVGARMANGLSASIYTFFANYGYYKELKKGFTTQPVLSKHHVGTSSFNRLFPLGDDGEEAYSEASTTEPSTASPETSEDDVAEEEHGVEGGAAAKKKGGWAKGLALRLGMSTGLMGSPTGQGMKRSGSDLFDTVKIGMGWEEDRSFSGIVDDAKLAIELAISKVFGFLRFVVRVCFVSPSNILKALGILRGRGSPGSEPCKGKGKGNLFQPFKHGSPPPGHDFVTAEDLIRRAGYPYERVTVCTSDGYILHMDRLPRPGARDVVYLQHGILDTSLGWVSNGVVGSQAFAAFDEGFDVWLGNMRGCPPQQHRNRIGRKYWHFSLNELAMHDVPAFIHKIHQIKCRELLGVKVGGGVDGRA